MNVAQILAEHKKVAQVLAEHKKVAQILAEHKKVAQILADIGYFRKKVSGMYFIPNVGSKIDVVLALNSDANGEYLDADDHYAVGVQNMKQRLASYGVKAQAVDFVRAINGRDSKNYDIKNSVSFTIDTSDDILLLLVAGWELKEQDEKISSLEYQLSTVDEKVEEAAEMAANLKRGVFSCGVNALKSQVDLLKNIRQLWRSESASVKLL